MTREGTSPNRHQNEKRSDKILEYQMPEKRVEIPTKRISEGLREV